MGAGGRLESTGILLVRKRREGWEKVAAGRGVATRHQEGERPQTPR